jgi:hypothetical protein
MGWAELTSNLRGLDKNLDHWSVHTCLKLELLGVLPLARSPIYPLFFNFVILSTDFKTKLPFTLDYTLLTRAGFLI